MVFNNLAKERSILPNALSIVIPLRLRARASASHASNAVIARDDGISNEAKFRVIRILSFRDGL